MSTIRPGRNSVNGNYSNPFFILWCASDEPDNTVRTPSPPRGPAGPTPSPRITPRAALCIHSSPSIPSTLTPHPSDSALLPLPLLLLSLQLLQIPLESGLNPLHSDLPDILTTRPDLVLDGPLPVMILDDAHSLRVAHHAAVRAHAEPEVAPLVAAVADGAVAV